MGEKLKEKRLIEGMPIWATSWTKQASCDGQAPPGETMWFQHLSEAEDQGVFLCSQSDSITVAHGEVDLATVTPQGGGVGWHPSGEQPGTDKNINIPSELIQKKQYFPSLWPCGKVSFA